MANPRQIAEAQARRYFKRPRDRAIFLRQMGTEAHFQDLTSPAGAQGPAQIMPGTAKAWGVRNVHDPRQAYAAAAAHMADYLRQYGGSWSKALTAYNAGPGAVGGRLPAETRGYISRILGGSDVSAGATASAPTSGITSRVVNTLRESSKLDQGAFDDARKLAVVGRLLAKRRGTGGALFQSGVLSTMDPNPADFMRSTLTGGVSTRKGAAGGSAAAAFPKGGSKLLELFWQGKGGINAKNGQKVPQGFVGGHTDHVHVAAGPKTVVGLGRLAQSMGLHVGENPHYGGVNPVHVKGSYHYRGEAIDVSGTPEQMRRYAHTVARRFGVH